MAHPRDLPAISALLEMSQIKETASAHGRVLVTSLLRQCLNEERSRLMKTPDSWQMPDWNELVTKKLAGHEAAKTIRAINGTGILLHTGLGRAPFSDEVVDALSKELRGATQVEVDPTTGKRSVRDAAVGKLINELFGGESALVVNNNAAATLLALHALGSGKDVVISRGELVEIGGSFRLPEIMIQAQVQLKEVGSTNKARLSDFENAMTDNTGLIMKAHTSNYRIVGFTAEVPLEDLVAIGKKRGIPILHDIGSGAFVDMTEFGLPFEPLSSQSLKAGADLVMFSGDKLLGGPQCGIVIGNKKFVDLCRNNPLARALRVDKMTLIALQTVLEQYREDKIKEIPLYNRLSLGPNKLQEEAEQLAKKIPSPFTARVESQAGEMGSGSVPGIEIPSYRVVIEHPDMTAEGVASHLRGYKIPIYGHIKEGVFGLNVLALPLQDHKVIIEAFN